MTSEESESSLEDGSDESSFRCLRRFFFFLRFFFFALESDEDVSDESDDEGSGLWFTSGLCLSSCFDISVDRCISLCHPTVETADIRSIDFATSTRAKILNGLRRYM